MNPAPFLRNVVKQRPHLAALRPQHEILQENQVRLRQHNVTASPKRVKSL